MRQKEEQLWRNYEAALEEYEQRSQRTIAEREALEDELIQLEQQIVQITNKIREVSGVAVVQQSVNAVVMEKEATSGSFVQVEANIKRENETIIKLADSSASD